MKNSNLIPGGTLGIDSEKFIVLYYNTTGDDKTIYTENSIYIQGKPVGLCGLNVNVVYVINSDNLDNEWFDRNIRPLVVDGLIVINNY